MFHRWKDVERLARKFKLDEPVASRLTELVHRRKSQNEPERATKDLATIEQHLRYCKRTSAMATLLVLFDCCLGLASCSAGLLLRVE